MWYQSDFIFRSYEKYRGKWCSYFNFFSSFTVVVVFWELERVLLGIPITCSNIQFSPKISKFLSMVLSQWAKSPKKQSVGVYDNMALYFECRMNILAILPSWVVVDV